MKAGFILILCSVLVTLDSQAHDQIVHEAITVNAAEAAYANSPAFVSFINVISSDLSSVQATNSMRVGSFEEDDGPTNILDDGGGHRSYNHFYDPLGPTNSYGKGLSDIPPDFRGKVGLDSFTWASISNCLGYNYHALPFVSIKIADNLNTSNIWSWPNARYYEWLGLTATNQIQRQTNLDNMFRAVGQDMHLLEDASQPQHVRNEQHLDQPIPVIGTPWLSPIEEYGKKNVKNLNYGDGSMLNWTNAGFTKLEDFWDRHFYAPGNNSSALDADNNENPNGGPNTLGLAEWCNGNFLGDRHSYAEYFFQHNLDGSKNVKWYPYPSLFTSTPYLHHGAYTDSVTLKNNKQVNRYYLDKTGDGIQVSHFSTVSFFGANFPNKMFKPATSIRDDNVLSNYHNAFIPKAVKYSAGLLDYYFRGTFAASVNFDEGSQTYTFGITNTSGQDFSGGNFFLLQDSNTVDSTTVRTLVQTTPLTAILTNGILTNGTSMSFTCPGPITNPYILFYQGTIGVTNGTNALDPVDAGIAIATAGPSEQTIAYDNNWNTLTSFGLDADATITTNLESGEFPFTITPGNYEVIVNTAAFDDKGIIGGILSDTFSGAVGHCDAPNAIVNTIVPTGNVTITPDGRHLRINMSVTDTCGGSIGWVNVNITWRAWQGQLQ